MGTHEKPHLTFLDHHVLFVDEIVENLAKNNPDWVSVSSKHMEITDVGGITPVGVVEPLDHEVSVCARNEDNSHKHASKDTWQYRHHAHDYRVEVEKENENVIHFSRNKIKKPKNFNFSGNNGMNRT